MKPSLKLGVSFYIFTTLFLSISFVFGILSVYLVVKNNFDLYYFVPLLLDLVITCCFLSVAYYITNQILDVESNSKVFIITVRGGRQYLIYTTEFVTYSVHTIYIKIIFNKNKSLLIFKNPSYWNNSTKRLLEILEKIPQY